MNNDIKEILKKFDKEIKKVKPIRNPFSSEDKKYKEIGLYLEEKYFNIFKDTLDYITNLQTIEQQYSAILSENAELENKITNLQEENQRLKELDETYPIEEQLAEALKYENIYKSRIDKALYFIDMDKHISTNWDNLTNKEKDEFMLSLLIELENILQGDKGE